MVALKEIEDAKERCIYKSPITGMTHDGSWIYDMTEEEWEKYKRNEKRSENT